MNALLLPDDKRNRLAGAVGFGRVEQTHWELRDGLGQIRSCIDSIIERPANAGVS